MKWWSWIFPRGFWIRIRRHWPGEGELNPPMPLDTPITEEDVIEEIRKATKRKEGKHVESV